MTSFINKLLPKIIGAGIPADAVGVIGSNGSLTSQKGIATSIRLSTGRYRVTWLKPFSNNTYIAHVTIQSSVSTNTPSVRITSKQTTHIDYQSQWANPVVVADLDATGNVSATGI